MEATGTRCSANSGCTYTMPSSGSVTVRGAWATGSSGGVYVSPDCTYTVQAAVTCNTCEDGKYLSGCRGGSSGSCMTCAGCPAGEVRTGCSGTSEGACTSCDAGKYKTSSGSEACSECTTCPAGKVSSGCGGSSEGTCAVAVEVSMAVELPYTKASFESNKDTFREGVAAASMVTVDRVKINSVVEKTGSRRRLLASSVVVDFSVAASTSGAASVL